MRLPDFIRSHREPILEEWEAFAKTQLPAARCMSTLSLRDHSAEILEAMARDISEPQSEQEQTEKSVGRAPEQSSAPNTAAQTHALLRQKGGFDINQLGAEYRALRASVLRLWTAHSQPDPIQPEDVMRFNEAIDQALAESITYFDDQLQRSRKLFLGMLAHDLRNPVNAVILIGDYLAALEAGEEVTEAAASLKRCGGSIKALLEDLADFNRSQLGVGIQLRRAEVDLAPIFTAEVDLLRRAHPDSVITIHLEGNTTGHWDGARLQRVLRNLIANAIEHGTAGTAITVQVQGHASTLDFVVRNFGRTIPASSYDEIFSPLSQGPHGRHDRDVQSLGLGLFIVREVIQGHGGTVEVTSGRGETAFTVHLPRTLPEKLAPE